MPRNHASVAYVEPNYVFSGLTAAAGDGQTHDRAPDLEDYCIAFDIIAELESRHQDLTKMSSDNKVIVMSYEGKKDGKNTVRFMSGTKIGGYEKNNNGDYTARLAGQNHNVLTSYYADMHITDIVDYGTTEMLGIKSVDVDYNSTTVPIITVKFTDVRGMSIFQPSELNDDVSFNGIRGFSRDNIAQSFFHAFFTLPPPKFTIIMKGFYGRPVYYQVMCDKFDTAFDSKSGCFDVTARFIGYAYSFMADVSLNVLLAAPYSDYIGESYWDSQVKSGRFTIPDKNGNKVSMPKLYEIRRDIETLVKESDEKNQQTTSEEESDNHEIEIQELTKLRDMYRAWYDALYTLVCTKYGKDYCYKIGGEEKEDDYRYVFIFTNGKNITSSDLSSEYLQYDETFRNMSGDLVNAIDKFNSSNGSYRKLDNIPQEFKFLRKKVFRNLWYNDRTGKIMFDGFEPENVLPKKDTIDVVFGTDEEKQQKELRKLYNDGKYQYIDAFVIDLDYVDIKRRINSLINDANRKKDDKVKKAKALNMHMYEKMGWYPTIENFTKIVMAHLETLMKMMYDVVDNTKTRTLQSLGISNGEEGAVDINNKDKYVSPFPRVTSLITDDDGYTKSQDSWVGNFVNGEGFKEVDVVNGLFNGVSKIFELEEYIKKVQENLSSSEKPDETLVSVISMPLTSYDFTNNKNPYGTDTDVVDNMYAFAGKVCMRMMGIMSLNFFRKEFQTDWLSYVEKLGKIEAYNFNKLNKIINPKLFEAISENGIIGSGEKILAIVLGENKEVKDLPWKSDNGGDVNLLGKVANNGVWLTRYRATSVNAALPSKISIHPICSISYSDLNDALKQMNQFKYPINNEDITIIDNFDNMSYEKMLQIINKTGDASVFNTIRITDRCKDIWEMLGNAEADGIQEYKDILTKISSSIRPNTSSDDFMKDIIGSSDNGNKSFNTAVSEELLNEETKVSTDGDDERAIFAGENPDDENAKYSFENEPGYISEMVDGNIVNYTITESYAFKNDGSHKYLDKSKCLFLTQEFYGLNAWKRNGTSRIAFESKYVKIAHFIMSIDSINYATLAKECTNTAFSYMPNIALLQIGAAMAYYYTGYGLSVNFDINIARNGLPLPGSFENIVPVINSMSSAAKLAIIKNFKDWAKRNHWLVSELYLNKKINDYVNTDFEKIKSKHYEKFLINGNKTVKRALFNQKSSVIKRLTNELFKLVGVIKLTTGAVDNDNTYDGKKYRTIEEYKSSVYSIDRTQAETFLDSFLKTLREINKGSTEETGGPTTIANAPSQTTEDMKIEMYRYLKQLYDKWVGCTTLETWLFDRFFSDRTEENFLGNNFFFIDSFYNKVGDKLLINPVKISNMLVQTISSVDSNVMMYNFLVQVYAEHRCMMRCIQNFAMLSDGITEIFNPLPYNRMDSPKVMSDFVVVYTYESSRNLNIANSEYKDDGFMLNDEFETPLPIKSRGDESRFYKIPAFGVSYGRQYQNYFKAVNVDMKHPVMTEQAIIAKHNVLAASRNKVQKGTSAQDLYDIFSNQSYTCVVEMMGCAFVQPLMYFVLLNVPFFKGSYLISKVKHRIVPGDMTTEITGVRMSKYCNKMVTEMFTDEEDETLEGGTYEDNKKHMAADIDNDCPYKVFPIMEATNNVTMTSDENDNANKLMEILMSKGASKVVAAGIVGNMAIETGYVKGRNRFRFDPQTVNPNDSGYVAAGLCQWNDSYYTLHQMLDNDYSNYGHGKYKSHFVPSTADTVRKLLADKTAEYQCEFIIRSLRDNTNKKEKDLWNKLTSATNPRDAANIFCNGKSSKSQYLGYENPNPNYAHLSDRMDWAEKVFKEYKDGSNEKVSVDSTPDMKKYPELYVAAIQKSLNSTGRYIGELEAKYNDDGTVEIDIKDKKKEKLAVLFDIILNSNEYYSHISNLNWVYVNSPGEFPAYIQVFPMENPSQNERRIDVYNGKSETASNKLNGSDCNDRLVRSLAKRYANNKKLFGLECPQFSNSMEFFDKFKPTDCNSLFSSSERNAESPSDISPSANIMIDGWDVGKAVKWLKEHADKCTKGGYCGKGLCATYVENAIAGCDGSGCKSTTGLRRVATSEAGSTHATNLWYYHLLEKIDSGGNSGFVQIATGNCTPTEAGRKVNMSLQAGDIAIIGRNAKVEGGVYHACMWSGEEWISDYYQGEKMSPYGNKKYYPNGTLPYAIFRYHNKKGTPKA